MSNTPKKEYKTKTISFPSPAMPNASTESTTPKPTPEIPYHKLVATHPVYPKGVVLHGFARGTKGVDYNEAFYSGRSLPETITANDHIEVDWFLVRILNDCSRTEKLPPLPPVNNWNDYLNFTDEQIDLYFRYYLSAYPSGISLTHLMGMPSSFRERIQSSMLNSATKKALYVSMVTNYLFFYIEYMCDFNKTFDHVSFNESQIRKMGDDMYTHLHIEHDTLFSRNPYLETLIKTGYSGMFLDDLFQEVNKLPRIQAHRFAFSGIAANIVITKMSRTANRHLERGNCESIIALTPKEVVSKLPPIQEVLEACNRIANYKDYYDKLKLQHEDSPQCSADLPRYNELGSSSLQSIDPILGERINRDAKDCRVYFNEFQIPTLYELEFLTYLITEQAFDVRYVPSERAINNRDSGFGKISPVTYETNQRGRGQSGAREIHRMLNLGASLSFELDGVLSALSYAMSVESGSFDAWSIEFAKYFETEENYHLFFKGADALRNIVEVLRILNNAVGSLSSRLHCGGVREAYNNVINVGLRKERFEIRSDILLVLTKELDIGDAVELKYQAGIVSMDQLLDTNAVDAKLNLDVYK